MADTFQSVHQTTIPSWTPPGAHGERGSGDRTVVLPAELVAGLRGAAEDCGTKLHDVLLAVHLKVLSTVTSERDVVSGYVPVPAGGASGARSPQLARPAPWPCRAVVADGSWRRLVAGASAARAESARPRGHPEAATQDDGKPAYTSILDLSRLDGAVEPFAEDYSVTANRRTLHVEVGRRGDDLALLLRYPLALMSHEHVGRLAGYYVKAMELLAADPGAAHHRQTLLSEHEIQLQLHGLAGRREQLPGRSFVELFEEQARRRPDSPAAAHRGHQWSYQDLNRRANGIAHALLERGLDAEGVVAVVMERNLEWLAAIIGVLKAGAAYLPIRPDFPAERIAAQLGRSHCSLVLTEPGSTTTLDVAIASLGRDCTVLLAADASQGGRATRNPAVTIEPGQLAYIYFTSGSTGAPKGAMCEHAGLLNHLYAKIEDMEIREGDVVAQTASQCFDISLWQAIAPLLVGGGVHVVDTDVMMDPERFLAEIATAGVRVLQVVPSYLEVLLSYLEEQPVGLDEVRSVSVTGEALKLGLVRRWFARCPRIKLVNAYGATEVSDDTMHEVMERAPERDFVPVGRPLRNVSTYVLDEHLRLVPLGSPGEIAFSGMCVGRGYINDEERTRQAFVPDTYRPDTRMYRTGDFGRWLPEGKIEFLGRRDEQVKVRGFRIEIGEIENRLLSMPGVRDAAVVIDGGKSQSKNLVAFFSGSDSLRGGQLREFLARSLPDYMIPAYFHRFDALPLNENGKVNKKMLAQLADALGHAGAAYVAPSTQTERLVATAWAEVLNVSLERIGRADSFFELGGTSLAAVRLIVKLNRQVSLKQLNRTPVLADLAAAIDGGDAATRRTASSETTSRRPRAGGDLLQPLAVAAQGAIGTLICFPYAGGNAVNFQLLAREVARGGIAVYGVELPGHDLAGGDEPLVGVEEVARQVRDEVAAALATPILLWGHCAGAAFALELARLLERTSREASRIFIGAMLLDEVDRLRREIDEVSAMDDREIVERLRQHSAYVELDGLKSERVELVGSAYRHDVRSTNRYLIAARQDPAAHRLRTGLDVVVAADDPTTVGYRRRYRDWELLTDRVELHELGEGGHYFARARAAETAALILAACSDLAPSRSA